MIVLLALLMDKFMTRFQLILTKKNNYFYDEDNLLGVPVNFKEIVSKLSELTADTLSINLTTLRYYQNIGLIDKPIRFGREAKYSFSTILDLQGIHALKTMYRLKIPEIKKLKKNRRTNYHIIAFVLQQLEKNYLLWSHAPALRKHVYELNLKLTEMEDSEELVVHNVTKGNIRKMKTEFEQLPSLLLYDSLSTIPSLRKQYFQMVTLGENPLHITIEMK